MWGFPRSGEEDKSFAVWSLYSVIPVDVSE